MQPKFIVIEGGEGSGKSTLCNSLIEHYPSFLLTHEPGGTLYGMAVKKLFKSFWNQIDDWSASHLMWSVRRDNIVHYVRIALSRGQHVICDRSDGATYAYQVYGSDVMSTDRFWETREHCFEGTVPDMYIYLDVDPVVALKRLTRSKTKEKATFDFADMEKHQSIRAGYQEFMADPRINSHTIDASQTPAQVLDRAIQIIEECIQ